MVSSCSSGATSTWRQPVPLCANLLSLLVIAWHRSFQDAHHHLPCGPSRHCCRYPLCSGGTLNPSLDLSNDSDNDLICEPNNIPQHPNNRDMAYIIANSDPIELFVDSKYIEEERRAHRTNSYLLEALWLSKFSDGGVSLLCYWCTCGELRSRFLVRAWDESNKNLHGDWKIKIGKRASYRGWYWG